MIDQTSLQTKRKNDVTCSSFSSSYLRFSACNWAEINLEPLIPAVSAPVEDIFWSEVTKLGTHFSLKNSSSEGRQHRPGFLLMFRQPGFSSVSPRLFVIFQPSSQMYTCHILTTFPSLLSLSLSVLSSSDLTAISPSSSASSINSAQSSKTSSISSLKCGVTDYFLCLSTLILVPHKRITEVLMLWRQPVSYPVFLELSMVEQVSEQVWYSFEIALRLKGQGKKVRLVTLITRIYSEVAREIYKFRERRR